ncbi:hypothetical protein [Mongoliitalea lutea]|uniref:Uncharacterized protein n=1 Tax=Mongoliitalea lutea TaxID=849756 RepID=A0A8J3CUK6_9BACT|nr:hypothetical protein [Mongoliitalea lutea]GHB27605.1 hypothetical protein GCM10008106_05440 [Mongoliitalea lutea]
MNKVQLFFHHIFKFIWNLIFVVSYPILATFGVLLIAVTWLFSALSRLLASLRGKKAAVEEIETDWKELPGTNGLLEGKVFKQIMFGPTGFQIRRKDGVPSVLHDYIFGSKVKFIETGLILEKWNATDSKDLPDFDICLYNPDEDSLTVLTNIKCFDWHVAEVQQKELQFKWFDGIQGGEVSVAI